MTQSDRSRAATFQLLAGLTIDEKIALLSGASSWQTVGYPDRGIRSMLLSDGPHGVGAGAAGELVGTPGAPTAVCFPPHPHCPAAGTVAWLAPRAPRSRPRLGEPAWMCCSDRA